jgi:phenylpyruvate tautomerase PptA (4-oxalocrotonate tautomerase family)
VHQHHAAEMKIEDTGLGIPRTDRVVIVQVTTRPRTQVEKEAFYELLCQELVQRCGMKASDVVVSITENTDEDWSFGYGRAQFITEELRA